MNKIFWMFVILVVLAPLPFGLVYSITQAFFACAVMVLVLGYCAVQAKNGNGPQVSLTSIWPETVGFILVLAWGVVQISTFTPEVWHHPLWAEASAVLGTELRSSISLARGAGFESIMRILTYAVWLDFSGAGATMSILWLVFAPASWWGCTHWWTSACRSLRWP